MDVVRTPDERFEGLAGFDVAPHHVEVGGLRMQVVGRASAGFSPDPQEVLDAAYRAPFHTPASMAGAAAWPAMLPFADPVRGGAARQEAVLRALRSWDRPAHVLFGDQDPVFTVEWGRRFAAAIPGATFDVVEGAGHFVQEVGAPLAERVVAAISAEA